MTEKLNVIEGLSAVMRALPGIGKDSKADPRQGGYAYRGIEAITREVQPLFAQYGIVFVPRVVSYEIREILVNDKPWTDTIAMIEYDVYGEGGPADKITIGPLLAIGRDNSDKGGNKCATQAFKYALLQALCIADARDDSDRGSPEADRPQQADPLLAKRAELGRVATERKLSAERAKELLAEWFGEGATSQSLDEGQLNKAIARMRKVEADAASTD